MAALIRQNVVEEIISDFNDKKEILQNPLVKSGLDAMVAFFVLPEEARQQLGGHFALHAARRDHVSTLEHLRTEQVDLTQPVETGDGTRQTPLEAAEANGSQKAADYLRAVARQGGSRRVAAGLTSRTPHR